MNKMNRLSEDINLSKKFPGYFNQWIFRPLVVAMILLFVIALHSNGWQWSGSYSECKGSMPCYNPEYDPSCQLGSSCSVEVMQPGEVFGVKPSWLAANVGVLEFVLIVFAFGVNHLLYRWRMYNG